MSFPLARTALLSMTLVLSACPDKQEKAAPAPAPTTATAAGDARAPENLFAKMGCRSCHGPSGPYAPVLAKAREKSVEVLAMSIIDMPKVRPGTTMPSFAGILSTDDALALAHWIKAGNPAPANP